MADYLDEESNYGDDDLDKLPQDTLIELENNAIQYTQARLVAAQTFDFGHDLEDEELENTGAVVIDRSGNNPHQVLSFQRDRISAISVPDVLDRQKVDLTLRPSPSTRSSHGSRILATSQDDCLGSKQAIQSLDTSSKVLNLQKQVEELLIERDALKQDLISKTGEIAIVRSKQDKLIKEHEQKLFAIQKLNEEKIEQQQKALELAQISERLAATDRDFIKRDLAEESERVRRLNREREREKECSSILVKTPRKRKNLSRGDGFDDDRVKLLSPSKICSSKPQKKLAGPSTISRRLKRKANDMLPQGVNNLDESILPEKMYQLVMLSEIKLSSLPKQDDNSDFIKIILEHCVDKKHLRTIQEFEKYSLPSTPNETLQSLILSQLSDIGKGRSSKDLAACFCETLVTIWTNCVEQEYFKPLYLVINLLIQALEWKTSSLAPQIIDTLLPLIQKTADFIAIPRFQSQPTDKYDKDINLTTCMTLLYLVSLGCMTNLQHITRFWKLMRWDFILLMLSTNQFQEDYDLIIRLLSTSVMKSSLGALPGGEKQQLQTGWIIDRLTYPLNEHPCKPMSGEKFDNKILSHVRLKIVQLLTRISRSPYGSRALATHPQAIGRIVCLISDELDKLYDFYSETEESSQIINTAMRLLYHLVTKHDECALDIQRNLANIHGGPQKYLLSLSRLNFLEEDLVLESGIDLDIAGFALELLELIVTPEEGDAIQAAFSN